MTYDALGRKLSEAGPFGTTTSEYDLAGRRTRLSWPGGFSVDYDYLVTGEVAAIREGGATSGAGVRAVFAYDNLGRRTGLTRGNGSTTAYAYDALSRLQSLSHDLAGTAHDVTIALTYNPASQIATRTLSNDLYAWTGHGSGSTSSTVNGLNQLTLSGGASYAYDLKGNMISDGTRSYAFSSENLLGTLGSGPTAATVRYDPAMRLLDVTENGNATRFLFDGGDLIAEYANGNLITRTIPGPGTDEPMGSTNASGSRSWHYADERGSIIATEGSTLRINTYDEYGKPGPNPTGRFGYTGLPRFTQQLYYSRARLYDWNSGRFVQPDPIGYGDGMNMYGYVGGDPVNFADPTGTDMENALYSNRAHPIDNDDEWYLGKGVNLIALAGGHSRDGMGMSDLVRMAGGRHETAAFERWQAVDARLDSISASTGVSKRCLLSDSCTRLTASLQLASGQSIKSSGEWSGLGQVRSLGGNQIGLLPSISIQGYSEIAVVYRFPTRAPGMNNPLSLVGSVGLRFEQSGSFWALGNYTLTGVIGIFHTQRLTLPAGTNKITVYPTPHTPPDTGLYFYGRNKQGK